MQLRFSPLWLPLGSLALSAAPAAAQSISVVLREGAPLAADPTVNVGTIDTPTANGAGGWAVGFSASGTISGDVIFGSVDGVTAPAVLWQQGTYSGYAQGSYEFTIGFSDAGQSSYSPSASFGGGPFNDSVFVDALPVAVEGDPIPSLPGKVWRFASRPGIVTSTSDPVFVGGIDDASGADEGNGLFQGFLATPLIKSGDVVPGVAFPLETGSSIDFDYRVSPDGLHYIVPVDTQSGSTATDIAVVRDGAGLTVLGLPVVEGSPLPLALAVVPGENWANFDWFGIRDGGSYVMSGDTSAPTTQDEFVLEDGSMVLRDGDPVGGGFSVQGDIEALSLSARGDLAVVWDVSAGADEALLFNGRLLLRETDPFDLDGDGTPDGTVSGFVGTNALAVTTERRIYVSIDVDTAGTTSTTDDVEVLAEIAVPDLLASGDTISLSAGGQVDFTLFTRRDVEADVFLLLGSVSGTSPGLPLDGGLVLPLNLDAWLLFTLTNPSNPLLPGSLGAPDDLGVGGASFVLPPASSPALAGVVGSFAFLTLDLAPVLLVTSVSNAVDVTLVP
jgi:hypothetical protein